MYPSISLDWQVHSKRAIITMEHLNCRNSRLEMMASIMIIIHHFCIKSAKYLTELCKAFFVKRVFGANQAILNTVFRSNLRTYFSYVKSAQIIDSRSHFFGSLFGLFGSKIMSMETFRYSRSHKKKQT